jgi:arylformamidase
MPLYRQFTTQDQLDDEYDPERFVTTPGGLSNLRAHRAEINRDILALPERLAARPYGQTLVETVDIYPAAEPNAPIVFYMHGGYWSAPVFKESLGWVSIGPRQRGYTTIVVDYGQCPLVTLDEVVRQCRAALAWTYRNAGSFGGDREKIYVTGNSAGGHLTAMLCLTDWEGLYGLPRGIIKGGCPFSGLYDLTPLRYTWLQPKLQLDGDQVFRNSPMFHIQSDAPPLLILWGADESKEFWRQSEDFHRAYVAAGNTAQLSAISLCDHYSLLSAWRLPESAQFNMIMDHMESCIA